MRLFVAVVPPAVVVADLDERVSVIRDDALRWASTDSWHVTLAFYGEVGDKALAGLGPRLERAARRCPPLALALGGAGRFDGRALWVGCSGDLVALRKLVRSVRAAGRRVGAAHEARRFMPHVTLARSTRPVDLAPYVAALAGYGGPTWEAGEIALVRSELGAGDRGRPRYTTLSTFRLHQA